MTEQATDITEPRHEAAEGPKELTFKTDPDGRNLTARMARGIIDTVRTVRPEWSVADLAAALDECRDSDPVETNLALIAAALNPNVTTPYVIIHHGVWWEAAAVFPPKPAPEVQMVPLPSRKDRKATGGIRATDLFQRNYTTARTKRIQEAKARGGTVIEGDEY